jgi:SPP1 family predicted phage head-tail adaptor
MRAGQLRHLIHIQTVSQVADGMGGFTDTNVDYIDCSRWANATAYVLGAVIKPTADNGYYYVCSRAGTSGGTAPVFPVVVGQTVNDPDANGAQWTCTGDGSINASIYPVRGKEILDNAKLELGVTHKIRIRYMIGITSDMKILFGSRSFNIISIINPEERSIYLEFLAEEVI